jgi:hypothetical protein
MLSGPRFARPCKNGAASEEQSEALPLASGRSPAAFAMNSMPHIQSDRSLMFKATNIFAF